MGLQEILWNLQNLTRNPLNFLDIFLVAAIFFLILQAVKGTRAATLLRGIAAVIALVWGLSIVFNLQAFSWLLNLTFTGLAIALPVIFQDELRRWLDRLGRMLQQSGQSDDPLQRDSLIAEIADATHFLSRRRHGALIVLERETGLQEYAESGVPLDAIVTTELLQTVFFPKTALHDGAVIIRGNRAIAAACTMPISTARRLPDRSMGLRHRASLGISEVSDSIAIVVSEESGRISLVVNGRFIRGLDSERLSMILGEYIEESQPWRPISWLQRRLRPSN